MTAENPAVTVGLPVFNGENYLNEALESLLSQDFEDFELVISDNASTDNTRLILEEWAARDPRVKVSLNDRNVGGAANFNRVLALARGQYFRWASHDDLVAPEMLRTCMTVIEEEGSSCVLVYPQTVIIDDEGSAVEVFDNNLDLRSSDPVHRLRAFIKNYTLSNVLFGLMRTEAIRSTGGIPDYNPGDVVMIAALALRGRFVEIPKPLFMRRVHEEMSWKASKTPEGFAQWFNPDRDPLIVFPRWRAWRGMIRVAWSSPLTMGEKVRATAVVLLTWPNRYGSQLFREITRMPKGLLRRTIRPR